MASEVPLDELLNQGLRLMGLGMGFVFLFLILLVCSLMLTARLVRNFRAHEPATGNATPTAPGTISAGSELHAVIAAALHRYRARRQR